MNVGFDKQLQVFDKKAVVDASVSSDPIVFEDDGEGIAGMAFDIRVDTAFTTVDVGSLVFKIEDSPDDDTYTARASSASYGAAALVASSGGKPLLSIACPRGLKKYVRLTATLTNNFTAGAFSAILNTAK